MHDNREKQVYRCRMDVIFPIILACVLLGTAIATSSSNLIQLFVIHVLVRNTICSTLTVAIPDLQGPPINREYFGSG